MWGSPRDCHRGVMLSEWLEEMNLQVINTRVPTFYRDDCKSHIDITACSIGLIDRVTDWVATEEENLSYYRNINFNVRVGGTQGCVGVLSEEIGGWRFLETRLKEAAAKLRDSFREVPPNDITVERLYELLTIICNDTFPKRKRGAGKKSNYWWNEEIANMRKVCVSARRKLTRERRRSQGDSWGLLKREYQESRKNPKTAIIRSKDRCWKKLLEELDADVWGTAYQIAFKRLGGRNALKISDEKKLSIARDLFPQTEKITWTRLRVSEEEISYFTEEELRKVIEDTKNKKAPGRDGFSPELI